MKKRSYIITALLAVSMLAAGCSSSAETIVSGSGTESGSGRLNVDSQRSEDTEELETAGVTTKQLAGEVKQKYASEENMNMQSRCWISQETRAFSLPLVSTLVKRG